MAARAIVKRVEARANIMYRRNGLEDDIEQAIFTDEQAFMRVFVLTTFCSVQSLAQGCVSPPIR